MMQNSNLPGHDSAPNNPPEWSGFISVDDTKLYTVDTGGSGTPIVYLNGQFANMTYWSKVIDNMGENYRHITYDERARGRKSGTSDDYSFETVVLDVDVILKSRNIKKCIVVGWSYGAFVAAYWASRNPDRCLGAVLVDGAQPYDWMTEEMAKRIRKLFRWLNPVMWILRPTGITARLSATKMAEINIELGCLATKKELMPVMDNIKVPTRYVLASGTSFGSKGDEQELIRTSCNDVTARNPNIKISAKTKSNHGNILRKDFLRVADTIREVASLIAIKN